VGVGSGLLRQLRVKDPSVVSHPEEKQMLVVGDPPSGMARLPGAREEAVHVASLFKDLGWSVLEQIRNESGPPGISASSVIGTLLNNDVRILHLAGHGVYDPSDAMKTGMVLGGGKDADDPKLLLTSSEVRQMRMQPELVFINCCHLGHIERSEDTPPLHRLAANLAAQFIYSGVKAVVAAGWPVDDAAATTFCDTFYTSMLSGEDFGNAVKRARESTYREHRRTNTWGAYQCYGDPGFRLLMDVKVRARATRRYYWSSDFVDASEMLIELGNLVSAARAENSEYDRKTISKKRDQLRQLASRKGWLKEEGVLAGIARVHGELGEFESALEVYSEALELEKSGMTITDLEQRANYRVRLGEKQEDVEAVTQGIAELDTLIERHGKTGERLSLLAGSYKRLAQLQSEAERSDSKAEEVRETVRQMTKQYEQAAGLGASNWYYPATNALLGVLLLGGPHSRSSRSKAALADRRVVKWAVEELFNERLAAIGAYLQGMSVDDFWAAAAQVDFGVVTALAEGNLAKQAGDLVRRLRRITTLYGSEREVDSVYNQCAASRS
jgi:tetratricopeptide (TPR) repeat protein